MLMNSNYGSTLSCTIEFLQPLLKKHKQEQKQKRSNIPFFVAISGPQGSGKSTLAEALCHTLSQGPYGLSVVPISVDDFYLTKEDLDRLSEVDPTNKLVSVRGPPGTHDTVIAARTMEALTDINCPNSSRTVSIPRYDKSAFGGRGDRHPPSQWTTIQAPVDVVIFEVWCVGFQSLPDQEIDEVLEQAAAETAHNRAGEDRSSEGKASIAPLSEHSSNSLRFMNRALGNYTCGAGVTAFTCEINWGAFIHLDPTELNNVFHWRLEQEQQLRKLKGTGMTDEQVEAFIKVYLPAYLLYMDNLRKGVVSGGRQLRLILGPERELTRIEIIE
ncbi:P-loop containing nucleoside triphosphate hydrolase protein [Aspergillus germanicus]